MIKTQQITTARAGINFPQEIPHFYINFFGKPFPRHRARVEGKDERKFIDLEREFLFAAQSRRDEEKSFSFHMLLRRIPRTRILSESNFDSPGLWLFGIPLT